MIGRFAVSGTIATAAFVLLQIVRVGDVGHIGFHAIELAVAPIALFALAVTRRWGRNGRLLFRKRSADERETTLLSEIDSRSISLFLVVATVPMILYLLGWGLADEGLRAGYEMGWRNGPRWIETARLAGLALQNTLGFVVVQSVIGVMRFARDARH